MYGIIDILKNNKFDKNLPLVIGFFDGLHHGHEKLFANLTSRHFNILTFTNVPSKNNVFLCSDKMRYKQLSLLSPRDLYIWDLEKVNISPKDFINSLKAKLNPSLIIVGNNFRFGKNRIGNVMLLKHYFRVKTLPCDQKVCTSAIKKYLQQAKIGIANNMLVEPYTISGVVVRNKRMGSKIGFPTANILISKANAILPDGVYMGYVFLANRKYPSAIFVRNLPTSQQVEAHILGGFNQNLYKTNITIQPTKFYKKPVLTKNIKELQNVIKNSVDGIKKILSAS
jgi:riboflavin kinase/FMN adenylyltransferase